MMQNNDMNTEPAYAPQPGNMAQPGGLQQRPAAQPYNAYRPLVAPKPENMFKPDVTDLLFALATFVIGYLFSRWVFFRWQGWGVTVFTTAYLLTATAYLARKGAFISSVATWFWLAVTWLTGASYTLWSNSGFAAIKALFLFCSATYYVITASGSTLMGNTGNYLIADGFRTVVLIPFRNFFNQYVSFSVLAKGDKRGKALPTILGILVGLILLIILIPLLERADSGGFGIIVRFLTDFYITNILEFIGYVLLAIPVAAYIYGLISGAAHKKGTDLIKPESATKTVAAMRVIHPLTIYIALGAVCGLYLVFILSQTPYFFSAFNGRRPEGWIIYSEYARRGFFELCGIAAINLVILTIGNLTCKKCRLDSRAMMLYNILLSVITLVLIATAFSKMALYIGAYGLTMRRLLPCILMACMALVFVALIVLQERNFSIVRFALVTGAIMICILSLSNPDAMVVRYNADRYLSGTLPTFDTEILYRSGSAGVIPALEVYGKTQDQELKNQIEAYLYAPGIYGESHELNLEIMQARKAIESK